MRLLLDEQAYLRVVDDFVAERLSASAFISGFRHLWRCDGARPLDDRGTTAQAGRNQAGLYGAMDLVNTLCSEYADNLPPGRGYRVSEEQFRKEIGCVTDTLERGARDRP